MTIGERAVLSLLRIAAAARRAAYHAAPSEERFVAWGRAESTLEAYERHIAEQDARDG